VVDIVTYGDPEIKLMKGTREPLIPDESDTENEEIGAIVVAVTPEICDEALKLIKVDWEVLPTLVDPRDGLKTDAPVVRIDPKNMKGNWTTGDVEAGFKEADQIVGFDWTQSLMASHIPNPNGSVSWWAQDPLGIENSAWTRQKSRSRTSTDLCRRRTPELLPVWCNA
jgi:CO/xanthine dehydrogenase Mo-binding subunit